MVGRPFDLLLLDINLPDQTGWDLLRYLRNGGHSASPDSLGPQAPAGMHEESTGLPQVIVMTAVRPPECRLREFRPAGVLVKPFPINALLQLIQRVLHISGDFEPAAEAYGELDDTDMRDAAITSANGLQAHNALDAQDADGT